MHYNRYCIMGNYFATFPYDRRKLKKVAPHNIVSFIYIKYHARAF